MLQSINDNIKLRWYKLYHPDLNRAFQNKKQSDWYRYLLYCKRKGILIDFIPISKEIKFKYKNYCYYPDFAVYYKFGRFFDETRALFFNPYFFKFVEVARIPVRIVTKKMLYLVQKKFGQEIKFGNNHSEVLPPPEDFDLLRQNQF